MIDNYYILDSEDLKQEIIYSVWLYLLPGITLENKIKLTGYVKSVTDLYKMNCDELKNKYKDIINEKIINLITYNKSLDNALAYIQLLNNKGIELLVKTDRRYPQLLRNIYDPPFILFCKGNIHLLSNSLNVGIVGARTPSIYGKEITRLYAGKLAEKGITIISGFAMGIDKEAHIGAINAGGSTVGVLACGVNVCYPRNNFSLYNNMCNEQLFISEYGIDEQPLQYRFPRRNRIISGLSKGIFVVEAKKKSGSLITADSALEQGRDVFALPGRVTDVLSEGTNNLIKSGAKIVTCPEDILEEYITYENVDIDYENRLVEIILTTKEKIIFDKLSLEPKHIDIILYETGLSVSEVLNILYQLEQKGLIKQPINSSYIRCIL